MRILHILDLHVLSGVWQCFCMFGGLLAAQRLSGSAYDGNPWRPERALTTTSTSGQNLRDKNKVEEPSESTSRDSPLLNSSN